MQGLFPRTLHRSLCFKHEIDEVKATSLTINNLRAFQPRRKLIGTNFWDRLKTAILLQSGIKSMMIVPLLVASGTLLFAGGIHGLLLPIGRFRQSCHGRNRCRVGGGLRAGLLDGAALGGIGRAHPVFQHHGGDCRRFRPSCQSVRPPRDMDAAAGMLRHRLCGRGNAIRSASSFATRIRSSAWAG